MGRHLLCWTHSGLEGREAVCVCVCLWGLRILGSVNCYIPHHQACVTVSFHRPLRRLYCRICNIMRGDNTDLIRGEVQRFKLPKWQFGERLHCVSCKNPFPLATQSVSTSVIYPLKDNTQKLSGCDLCLQLTDHWNDTLGFWDWLFLFVPVFSSWAAPGLWFSVRIFQSRVILKLIDMANVFSTVSSATLDESSRWFICLRALSQNQP